jgi:hypothetical protein
MLDLIKKPVFKFGVPVLSAIASAFQLGFTHPITISVVVCGVVLQFIVKSK